MWGPRTMEAGLGKGVGEDNIVGARGRAVVKGRAVGTAVVVELAQAAQSKAANVSRSRYAVVFDVRRNVFVVRVITGERGVVRAYCLPR